MKKKIIIITSIILTILAVAASSVYALWYISANRKIDPADITPNLVKAYIEAETREYNGKYQIPLSDKLDNSKLTYYYKNSSNEYIKINDINNLFNEGYIDAGTYDIQVSYDKTTNEDGTSKTETISDIEFSITPKELDISGLTPTNSSNLVYNGTSLTPTYDISSLLFDRDRKYVSLTATSTNTVNAGQHNASLSLTGDEPYVNNYELSNTSLSFNIAKRPIIIIWYGTSNLVYSASEHNVTYGINNLVDGESLSLNLNYYRNNTLDNTNKVFYAGSYQITASLPSSVNNYEITEGSSIKFNVDKKEITSLNVSFDKDLVYTASEITVTITSSDILYIGDILDDVSFSFHYSYNEPNETSKTNVNQCYDAGDYQIIIDSLTGNASENYKFSSLSSNFVVDQSDFDVTWKQESTSSSGITTLAMRHLATTVADDDKHVYNGSAQDYITEGITNSIYENDRGFVDINVLYLKDDTTTVTESIDVGIYEAKATLSGDRAFNYIINNDTKTYEITPKSININWQQDNNTSLTYDGNSINDEVIPSIVTSELYTRDNISLSVLYSDTNCIDVGSYTVSASLSGTGVRNYELVGDTTRTYTITQKVITLTWTKPANLTYNNQAKELEVSADICEADKTLVNFGIVYTGANATDGCINAGDYTATATLSNTTSVDKAKNYSISLNSCDFTISKANLNVSWTTTSYTYDKTNKNVKYSLTTTYDNYVSLAITYAQDERINVGTYSITSIALIGSTANNYTLNSYTLPSLEIKPITLAVTWSNYSNLTYDNTTKVVLGSIDNTSVITGDNINFNVEYSDTPKNAGDYTATATISNSNYQLSNETLEFSIAKAQVGLVWQRTDTYEYDATNKTVSFDNVSGLVSGDGSTVNITYSADECIDVGKYTATAVLSNTENYEFNTVRTTFDFTITPKPIDTSSLYLNKDISYNTSNSSSNLDITKFKNENIYSRDSDNVTISSSFNSADYNMVVSISDSSRNYSFDNTSITISMVAYISNTYYNTIEYSLDCSASGNTVYAIPNKNPSITRACEVKSGVTLTFPYEGTTYERTSSDDESPLSGFATADSGKYCKNKITIKKVTNSDGDIVATITINGTVNIGGQRRSTGPQGCTSGYYVEWLVESDVRIDIRGKLYCMGYIREDSDYNGSVINVYSTGTLTQPMVSYDWGSAGNAKGAIDEDIFPFNYFDCPQVSPSIYFYSGAKLEASVWMYGDTAGDMKANAYIIGDTSDIALVQSSRSGDLNEYIYWKNTDTVSGITLTNSKTTHKIELNIQGAYLLSYLIMNMTFKLPVINIDIPVNIDSRDYFLPFSNFFDIKVMKNASFDVQYPVKFLPGANITIENGGTVNINNSVIVYETITGDDGHSIYSYGVKTPAKLTNNGILNIYAPFGGKIYADSGGDSATKINVTTVESVTSRDAYAYGSGVTSNPASVTSFTLSGQADISTTDDGTYESDSALVAGTTYLYRTNGTNYYWYGEALIDLSAVFINPSDGTSDAGASATYNLTANVSPSNVDESELAYEWSCFGGTLSSTTGKNVKFTTPANSDKDNDITYTVTVKVTQTKSDGTTIIVVNSATFTAQKDSGCFAKGTEILMADGSYKKIEDIKVGDYIKTFNHETGMFENQFITYIPYQSENVYEALKLKFEDGYFIEVLFAHGFMNASTRKYEEISPDNVIDKLGQKYLFVENDNFVSKQLVSYEIYNKVTECYSLSSAYNLNHIANGALCISDDIEGLYNYFELDESFKYDEEKKAQDIAEYGLLSYGEVSYFMSYEIYELFNVKYLSVSIGKGMLTIEKMEEYIEKFA